MTKTLFEKMFLKDGYSAAVLHLPKELAQELQSNADITLKRKYNFILAFFSKEKELIEQAVQLNDSLLPNGLVWIAYPKNKALDTDLNRDILHALMEQFGFDGVSIISLNATWSAMRFKQL